MKALLRKELRENIRIAVIGLLVNTLLMFSAYHSSTRQIPQIENNLGYGRADLIMPLLASGFYLFIGLFCGIFGAALGWLQIHNERHRDLWAFLVHRPISRATIFWSKVIAGLVLYSIAAGLPLLGLIVAVATPGHIPAPFEWAMVLPALSYLLMGIVCYFAGLLTGIRQARWYVSRGLGLGTAIVVTLGVGGLPEFWQALLLTLIGGTILLTAVWGSFQTNGFFRSQPVLGKTALAVALTVGTFVVLFSTTIFVLSRLEEHTWEYTGYEMAKGGATYKVTRHGNGKTEIVDLDGVELKDPRNGQPMAYDEFNRLRPGGSLSFVDYHPDIRKGESYLTPTRYFIVWRASKENIWYWTRQGALVCYNVNKRRPAGILEPPGNESVTSPGQRFRAPVNYHYQNNPAQSLHTLATSTTAYHVDVDNRTVTPIVTTTNDDRIGSAHDDAASRSIVITRQSVYLIASNGVPIWKLPYQPGYPKYDNLTVYVLDTPDDYAVWFTPSYSLNEKSGWKTPIHVVRIHKGEGVLTNSALAGFDLPILPRPKDDNDHAPQYVLSFLAPSLIYAVAIIVQDSGALHGAGGFLRTTLAAAFLCIIAGWWLNRRHNASLKSQLGWALLHLLFGIPGFMAFICAQEWPARETCPSCRKPRAVDREHCEHCGAAFAPPEKNGTEIFER